MYLKKVRRKCNVRGCKNTDCFSLSRTRETGNSVIICKSCLGAALSAADEIDEKTGTNKKVTSGIPSLFFNHAAKVDASDTSDPSVENVEEASEASENSEEKTEYICEKCGKAFGSERGLRTHKKSCGTGADDK